MGSIESQTGTWALNGPHVIILIETGVCIYNHFILRLADDGRTAAGHCSCQK